MQEEICKYFSCNFFTIMVLSIMCLGNLAFNIYDLVLKLFNSTITMIISLNFLLKMYDFLLSCFIFLQNCFVVLDQFLDGTAILHFLDFPIPSNTIFGTQIPFVLVPIPARSKREGEVKQ